MLIREFENLIDDEIAYDDFDIVNTIYMNYPGITDKEKIAGIYKLGGMRVMLDMYPRAYEIQYKEEELNRLKREIRQTQERIKTLEWELENLR